MGWCTVQCHAVHGQVVYTVEPLSYLEPTYSWLTELQK